MSLAVEISNLTKTYKNGTTALHGISLAVEQGDFFALLGPNGAGKSTTISILTSLVRKSSGTIKVFGHDLEIESSLVKAAIGVVPQEFNFSVFETVETILFNQAGYYGLSRRKAKPRVEKYLKQLDLWDKRKSTARSLSGGMKRRLMIARALVHEPRLLILDEPTAGVDIEIRRSLWDFLRQLNQDGITIILTTHYLEEAEQLCRNIAIIDKGHIIRNSDTRSLLREQEFETFILDLKAPNEIVISDDEILFKTIDTLTLEVSIPRHKTINQAFEILNQLGIEVTSMRNKSNRLETLFLNLTQRGNT